MSNWMRSGLHVARVATVYIVLGTAAVGVVADSFMSSTEFLTPDTNENTKSATLDEAAEPPTAYEMLAVMEWKSSEDKQGETYDLGAGVRSPQGARDALVWAELAREDASVCDERRFLALYKACWDSDDARLIAEMQSIKTVMAFTDNVDTAKQSVMALGVALATVQMDMFGSRAIYGDPGVASVVAGASFSEAVVHARAKTTSDNDRAALRSALKSAWEYLGYYPALVKQFRAFLTPNARKWLR